MSNNLAGLALVLLLELVAASSAAAQSLYADRFMLNLGGPCAITSGTAAPNGAMVGNVCDTYVQTATGAIWTKTSGTGTSSGWLATLAGQGTTGRLPLWSSATGLGDSAVSQAGGTVTITGAAAVTGTIDITGAATLRSSASITGDTTIGGNTTLGGWIGTASYASQVSGWRITPAGAADVRYLFTDELRARLFTADAESVLAGSMRVTKSYSTIAQPFTCPAASSAAPLWVFDASTYGDAPVFQAGDWIVIHVLTRAAFGPFTIADCVGTVASYVDGSGANAGQQQWTFTRGAGANGGAMTGGAVVSVNQLVQDLGVSGNGYIEMSAVDGANGSNAPYIQTNVFTGAPVAANITTNCRLGNLNGLTALNDYGLLCGKFVVNGPFFWMSTAGIEMRNLALTMFDNGTQVFTVDPHAGSPVLALGSPLPTSFTGNNAGLWAGKDTDGTYKLRIGNPIGNRLTWNGSQLSIVGEGSGITNINGGNIQAGTISATAINVRPIGAALNSDPNALSQGAWGEAANGSYQAAVTTITDGAVGTHSLRSPTGHSVLPIDVTPIPIDTHKQYRLHAWVRAAAGATGLFRLSILCISGTGAQLTSVDAVTATGVPTTWTEYSGLVPPMPGGTVSGYLLVYLNYNGADIQNAPGYMEAQDMRVEEALPSTLIKDGAITTNKVAAGAITADQIAANTITVGNLNATGFGDNLIKNSTFEGTPAHALDGWFLDPASGGAPTIQQSCCGTRGSGTLLLTLSGGASANGEIGYYAVPVQPGTSYRVALDVWSGSAVPAGFYVLMLESTTTTMPRWVRTPGAVPPDVAYSSGPQLLSNVGLAVSWNHFEMTYTPTVGVYWASLTILNNTCAAGTCVTNMHFDAVEVQPQLGAGHIRAASITADRLVANSITSAQIAAGTITSTQIAAGTITGGNIAGGTITGGNIAGRTITAGALVANTITSNELGVRAIVAGNIATGTLTANELAANTITGDRIAAGTIVGGNIAGGTISAYNIQANSITADRLSVSSLSAISANLGTVTAGTINGITITGTTINGGTVNGTAITGGSININGGQFQVDLSGNLNANGTTNIRALNAGYNAGGVSTVNFNGEVYIAPGMGLTINGLGGSGNRLVCTNTNGRLYTSAANGSC